MQPRVQEEVGQVPFTTSKSRATDMNYLKVKLEELKQVASAK